MNKKFIYILMLLFCVSFVNAAILFEDDFEDGSINTSKWDIFGSSLFSETSGELRGTGGSGWNSVIASDSTYSRAANVTLNSSCYFTASPSGTDAFMIGLHDSGTGSSYTDFVYTIYCSNSASVHRLNVYEDGNFRFEFDLPNSSFYNNAFLDVQIVLKDTGAYYYYKRKSDTDYFLLYNSNYSSESNLKVGYAYNQGIMRSEEMYLFTAEPVPVNGTISIDDISLVNNSYHNSDIDIQLNLSVTGTSSNVNTSYILYKTFNNPTYNGYNISQSSTVPFIIDGLITRNQFCIENNYDGASAYTSSSYTNQAIYYNGSAWVLTGVNANKYDSIACQKEIQFGTNTLQPNTTIELFELDIASTYNGSQITGEFDLKNTVDRYCFENYGTFAHNYTQASTTLGSRFWFNGSEWKSSLSTSNINRIWCNSFDQGGKNIYFYAENNETNTTSATYTFTIDTVNPSTEVITNQTEFNTFSINMSEIFNYSDINLNTCEIYLTELENVSTNDTSTLSCDAYYNFTTAGLHNLRINVTDLAGNYNDTTQLNITINPFVYVYFNDKLNSTILKSYTPTIYHPDGRVTTGTIDSNGATILSPVNNDSLDLGLHTIKFEKTGYATENFTVLVNSTNAGRNETFNVTRSKIIVNIYDRFTTNRLTGTTTLTLVATYGANATTTTGQYNFSNISFLAEQYQLISRHDNYDTESVYFNYDNQANINVDIYMLESNRSDQITVRVLTQVGQLISEATCSLLEWKPTLSSFISVAQLSTNVNGEGKFNVELGTKLYKIQCTKAGLTVTSIPSQQIFNTADEIIPIIFDEDQEIFDNKLKGVSYSLYNLTYNSSHQQIIFTWNDDNNLVKQGCIKAYKKQINSRQLLSSICASGSSSNIQTLVNINNTYDLIVVGQVIDSNGLNEELDEIIFKSTNSLQTILSKSSIVVLIPLISVLAAIAFGLSIKPQTIYISMFGILIVIWGNYALFPSIMLLGTTIFITFIDILIMWGSYRVRR